MRIGIVGAKSIGRMHGQALADIAGDSVADLEVVSYSGQVEAAELAWPGAVQRSHAEILADPGLHVVVLCSPTNLHGAQAIAVAESGRAVVVEKPIALEVAEAARLYELERAGARIAMISQRRHEFPYPQVHQLLAAGELGSPRLLMTAVHWHRDAEYFAEAPWRTRGADGGGSLVNQGVHNLDLFQWLGGPVASVAAHVSSQTGLNDHEDTLAASVAFASGALGVVTTSTATPPGFDATLTIHTDRGRIVLGQGEIVSWDIDAPAPEGTRLAAGGSASPLGIGTAGHEAAWREILAAFAGSRRPLVNAAEGLKVTRLIDGMYRSAATGHRVDLPPLD